MVYLKRFTLPKTDVRMITIDNKLFKIGIHLVKHPNRKEESYKEFCSNIKYQEEIEKIMMILLTCKGKLGPIKTDNFTVYPNQRKWKCASSLRFYKHKRLLENCPLQTHFYIEPNLSRKHDIETEKQCTAVQSMTKQSPYQNQSSSSTRQSTKTQNDAKTTAEIKSKSPSTTGRKNNDQTQAHNTEKKFENSSKVYDESEDDQSVPILNGAQCCDVLRPEDIGSGTFSRNIDNESLSSRNKVASLETAKQDIQAENKKSNEAVKLIFVSETTGQTRKRRGGVLDEAPPKKKNFSEYLDTNRHVVQEEELQELLRFQDMATAPDETPAAVEEQRHANIRQVFRSVKKLVFG